MDLGPAREGLPSAGRALLLFGTVVSLTHHVGLLTGPLGHVGVTSWNDWLDLLVPWLVVGSSLLVVLAAGADTVTWCLFGVGTLMYVEGHGLHLAANSVGNADPGPTAHLWDEVVGHGLWYAGLAVLVVALTRALAGVPLSVHPLGWLVAVAFGITVATNAAGADAGAAGLVVSMALAAFGLARRREPRGQLLVLAFGVAAAASVALLVI